MSTPSAVRVNDDLAAGKASVTLRATNDEFAGWVDVQVCVVAKQRQCGTAVLQGDLFQRLLDNLLNNQLVHVLHARGCHLRTSVASALLAPHRLQRLGMLGGNHHCMDLQGLHRAIFFLAILNCHLSFSIRAQPPQFAVLAHICQLLAQARSHGVRQGHAIFSLITGIAKHDALIASANIHLVFANVNTTCNVRTLFVDSHNNLACLVAQALAVNAGQIINEGIKSDAKNNPSDNLLVVNLGLSSDLTHHSNHVILCCRLTRNLAFWILGQTSVQDSVRHLITELVWMTFIHRLRREQK
mmetsp:Transcript_115276/g.187824  ORF Transcript_115276/g.187824 Transcript_115276/m.187824 type:complete len:299 (+) Transcript_115276:352-1248(+)